MGDQAPRLSVRETTHSDIALISDYWLNASDDHLIGMGVDLERVPPREVFERFLAAVVELPIEEKPSFALIWELDGKPIGHNNVNPFQLGRSAFMHLHVWDEENRRRGLGLQFLKMAVPVFFERLQLQELFCEPYAENPAPNRALEKLGFDFVKTYTTIPGSMNFEQKVNRWVLTRAKLESWVNQRGLGDGD